MTMLFKSFRRFAFCGITPVVAVLLPMQGFGLTELGDDSLSQVNGQQGLVMESSFGEMSIDRMYWEDKAGTPGAGTETTLRGYADGISITGSGLGSTLSLDFGSASGTPGVALDFSANLGTLAGQSFKVCDDTGTVCGGSLGALALQTTASSPLLLSLRTTDGLFNQNAPAQVSVGLQNVNLYFTQKAGAINNQLILQDFNFNFFGKGYAWVDATRGLLLETRDSPAAGFYIDLVRVQDKTYPTKTKPGLNLEFMSKTNAGAAYNLTGAQGLLRLGASGRLTDAYLNFRGTDATGVSDDLLGKATLANGTASTAPVMGSTGFGMRFKANFTRDSDNNGLDDTTGSNNPVELELAHPGDHAYGVSFGNLSPLLIRKQNGGGALNPDLAYFDSGSIYANLANTKKLQMPQNAVLNATKVGASFMTVAADYSHVVHDSAITNPNVLTTAVRGMDFQALSRRSRFVVSNNISDPALIPGSGGAWGLGLPFYNVNVNTALYGTTVGGAERIGAAFALSTQGVSADGSKTTSILVIDGEPNPNDGGNPTNYYLGLRNIDMYMAGYGSVGLEGGRINLDIASFTLAIATQVAGGYLPGSKFRTGSGYAPINGFTTWDDVLFGLNLKLAGSTSLQLVPAPVLTGTDAQKLAQNFMRFQGTMNVTSGALQFVEPVDKTVLGLDGLQGSLGLDNYLKINKDSVDFYAGLTINPANTPAGVLRIRDVNMYPAGGNAQRLGEMALTGGKLVSNLNIKPF